MTEVRQISIDSYQDEWDWEMFIGNVGDELERLANSDYNWFIEGRGMGWLKRNGYKEMIAETAWKLLRGFLPETDVSIVAEFHEDRMEFIVFHHDAPTGEFYTITPKEVENE
jgi:hypothetical protein